MSAFVLAYALIAIAALINGVYTAAQDAYDFPDFLIGLLAVVAVAVLWPVAVPLYGLYRLLS